MQYIWTKRLWSLLFMLLVTAGLHGQRRAGNDWIVPGQQYLKMKVAQRGLYRISMSDLQAAGVPVASADPRQFQLFSFGQEVPVYIEGEDDGTWDADDFIEFFGEPMTGKWDSVLYEYATDQPQPYRSMYGDSAAYFLTWNVAGTHLRYTAHAFPSNPGPVSKAVVMEESVKYYADAVYDGVPISSFYNFYGSEHNMGEGALGTAFSGNNNITFPMTGYQSGGDVPVLEFLAYSKSNNAAYPDQRLQVTIIAAGNPNKIVFDSTYDGFQRIHKRIPLTGINFNGSNITVRITSLAPAGSNSHRHVLAYAKLIYPRKTNSLNLDYQEFFAGPDANDMFFAASTNPLPTHPDKVMLDLERNIRTTANYINDIPWFSMPAAPMSSRLMLVDESKIMQPAVMQVMTFQPFSRYTQGANYIVVTHPTLWASAQEFAQFKNFQTSFNGETFKTMVVNVEELYDEFYYGAHHPAAIQNFFAYVYNNAVQKPKYGLLLGKGWQVDQMFNNAARRQTDLVPLIGLPPSDLLYVAGIDNGFSGGMDTTLTPPIALGRVSAASNEEVRAYLSKLAEHDAAGPELWQKRVIHVTGGYDKVDQDLNRKTVTKISPIIQGPHAGFGTRDFHAQSTGEVVMDLEKAIISQIDAGASMLTYLGHGSANIMGVSFGTPEELNNKGKYPFIYINGCDAGTPGYSSSLANDYLFAQEKGAIGWLAHSSRTFQHLLDMQMTHFYENFSREHYGGSIGEHMQHCITDMHASSGMFNSAVRAITMQWLLQGDPSLNLYSRPLPDYAVFSTDLGVFPEDALGGQDSFALRIPVKNLGKSQLDTLAVRIRQTTPSRQVIDHPKVLYAPIMRHDTVFYWIQLGTNIVGSNRFEVYLSTTDSVREITLDNNSAVFDYFFAGTGVNVLFPQPYSIVATITPKLTVQSRDIFHQDVEMYFELDTVPTFNSPFHKQSGVMTGGNIQQWQPQLLTEDTTVYYWRSRLNLPADSGGEWSAVRSFTYIQGSPEGWSQSHWPQFTESITGEGVVLHEGNREFRFNPTFRTLLVESNAFRHEQLGVTLQDGSGNITWGTCGTTTLVMVEFDEYTLDYFVHPYKGGPQWYNENCAGIGLQYHSYNMRLEADRARFVKDITELRNGNYVAVYSQKLGNKWWTWDSATYTAFDMIGAQYPRHITRDSTGWAFVGQKGPVMGTPIAEDTLYDWTNDRVNGGYLKELNIARVEPILEGRNWNGVLLSTVIGPATQWKQLNYRFDSLETNSKDSVWLSVYGIDMNGNEVLLMDSITESGIDLSGISARDYPYLRLKARLEDEYIRTTPQLRIWQVLYDGVPEGTLVVDADSKFPEKILAGDPMGFKAKFRNISSFPMDSVLVRMQVYENGILTATTDKFYQPLAPGEEFEIAENFVSNDYEGKVRVVITANPFYEQPEVSLDNNILRIETTVEQDKTNPVLDVTVDGRHIMNGEIVTATPQIVITAVDENRVLMLNDTSDVQVWLQYPGEQAARRIWMNRSDVRFYPAQSTDQPLRVEFNPEQLQSGYYKLTVQLQDRTGNPVATEPYEIWFRVISETQMSNFYAYPNPFTYSTTFNFMIGGDEVPQQISIMVYNMNGQAVDEINRSRMPGLKIGENQVQWLGVSKEGTPLPSGVYYYRVIASDDRFEIGKYNLPEDETLGAKDIYGKVVITR